ncbi:hypothetical protein [Tabrizicola sp.]|uniref:hypothetical protein n=1 Tax=Tabrizicola sp. TaxID=2005166 RepID=UPI003F34CC29
MTTIITRLYADTAAARAAANDLIGRGHSDDYISIITKDGDGSVADRMTASRVNAASARAYSPHVAKGAALLVVQAPFNPFGAARDAIRTLQKHKSLDAGVANENEYIREQPPIETSGKVMQGTVFFMSNPHRSMGHGHILGSNPILPAKPRTSAISGGAYMSTKFWPMKLVSSPKEGTSAIRGGFLFSSLFGIPTVVREWAPRDEIKTII